MKDFAAYTCLLLLFFLFPLIMHQWVRHYNLKGYQNISKEEADIKWEMCINCKGHFTGSRVIYLRYLLYVWMDFSTSSPFFIM